MTWKPREEYKTLVGRHNVILTRSKHSGPMLCVWVPQDKDGGFGGHFVVCPSVPIYYGKQVWGTLYNDYFDEWMDIPA